VLVVDDDPDICLIVRTVLENAKGFEVVGEATTGAEAIAVVERSMPDLVLLDERLPDVAGVEVASRIRALSADVLIVLFTAHLDDTVRAEAAATGVDAVVDKEKLLDLPASIAALHEGR
jgi:CheY-like chemotaxis protein